MRPRLHEFSQKGSRRLAPADWPNRTLVADSRGQPDREPRPVLVTERAILTLKQEWLKRVPVIRGLDHLSQLLDDFSEYYNHWRGRSTIGGAVPSLIHRGEVWQRPDRSAKTLPGAIERRLFPDTRITAFRLAA